jgi:3-isopropylmalate/(R)-2-methylmalate dehydratase large subunit
MRITVDGDLAPGVSAKDLALHIIRHIGVNGGTGFVIEYAGETIRALEMEGRMTLCNMTIEAGARAGMVGPDQKTVEYLRGRQKAPAADQFEARAGEWLSLATDPGSTFDREIQINAAKIRPTITFGTDPGMSVAIRDTVPAATTSSAQRAMSYMQVGAGKSLIGMPIDVVFVGSCTNGRLSDLRVAADYLRGKKVADNVRMLVVPGSEAVKRAAEAEGLQQVFLAAGAEWREPGCSMCLAMNGDIVGAGKLAVSTSNRNFEGRQGAGARTMLASPLTAAACAVAGCVTDPTDTIATSEVA